MALKEYTSKGYLVGGVTDETPDWLGSYNEGVQGAQTQIQNRLTAQEAKQRMAESAAAEQRAAAAEQRRATEFAQTQADREALLKSYAGTNAPERTPFVPQQGEGLLPDVFGPVRPPYTPGAETTGPTQSPEVAKNLGKYMPEFTQIESELGLPAGYLAASSIIESSAGLNVGDSKGKYVGMFQIGPEVAKDFNVTKEQLLDPRIAARVAALLAQRNAASLRKSLGREPQAWELYLAHQQGAGGAAALLKNPNARAIDVMTSVYGGDRAQAYRVIVGNGGNPDMTAGQFAQMWGTKFSGQPVTIEAPAAPAASAAPTPGVAVAPAETRKERYSPLAEAVGFGELGDARARQRAYSGIVDNLSGVTESAGGWIYRQVFGTVAGEEKKAEADAYKARMRQWYEQNKSSLLNDAQRIGEAAQNPLEFYRKNSGDTTPVPEGVALEYKGQAPTAQPTPGVQTQAAPASAAQPTPGVQTQTAPAPAAPPAAQPTPGVQTQQLQFPSANIPPSFLATAGVMEQGQGTIADQIARTPPGRVVTLPDSGVYLLEPMMVDVEMRNLEAQRADLLSRFEQAKAIRADISTLNDLKDKLIQNDAALDKMEGMKVLTQMQQGDDEQFARALSGLTGGRARIQRRPDNTYNYIYDGQLRAEGIDRNQIIAGLRMQYDEAFKAQVAARTAAEQEREKEFYKGEVEVRKAVMTEAARQAREMALEDQKKAFNADPRNAEYTATVKEDASGTPSLFLTPKRAGLPSVVWQYVPDIGVDGKPRVGPDGQQILVWKQQTLGGTNTVPVQ